jgi:Flp pilus assembly protein CpaB
VSRRARALAFCAAALACALLAAALASRYSASVDARFGELRPVLVAVSELPAGKPIAPAGAANALAVRRVPARFAPPGALRSADEAIGRAPAATVPAGSYLLSAQLVVPQPPQPAAAAAGGKRPLQLEVAGGEALVAGGASPEGGEVDVVVSRRSGLGNRGDAEVAADGVKLLALAAPDGAGDGWSATLAVSRDEALELIEAQAAGGEIRLLPRP